MGRSGTGLQVNGGLPRLGRLAGQPSMGEGRRKVSPAHLQAISTQLPCLAALKLCLSDCVHCLGAFPRSFASKSGWPKVSGALDCQGMVRLIKTRMGAAGERNAGHDSPTCLLNLGMRNALRGHGIERFAQVIAHPVDGTCSEILAGMGE
jgi:hypothetical protein